MSTEQLSNGKVRTLDTFGPVLAGASLDKVSIDTGKFDGVIEMLRVQCAGSNVKFSCFLYDKETSVDGDINNIVQVKKANTSLQQTLDVVYVNEDSPQDTVLWFDFENTGNVDSGIITVKLYIQQEPQQSGQPGELVIPRR